MKVFSKAKFLEVEGENEEFLQGDPTCGKRTWIDECDGKEVHLDMFGIGTIQLPEGRFYFISPDWCVDKED